MALTRSQVSQRRGTTAVETAIVLPIFLTFLFGIFVIGHVQMVSNTLKASCRAAARFGATEGVSTTEVEEFLQERLAAAVNPELVSIMVKDASALDSSEPDWPQSNDDFDSLPSIALNNAEPRQLFLVRATIDYGDVAILTLPWMGEIQLSGQAFMRHE